MLVADKLRRYAGKVMWPVICTLVVVYIVYHTVQGDRGLLAYFTYSQEVERAAATLKDLHETREKLEHRVALLRPESLDSDLLEERARIVLDLVRKDEVVVFLPREAHR